MKLSVLERLKLLDTLPREGTLATIRIVRRLREALSFSEAEFTKFGIQEVGGAIRWEKSEEREIPMGATAVALVVQTLKALDAQGKLSLDMLGLAEKFLIDPEAETNDAPASAELNGQPLATASGRI